MNDTSTRPDGMAGKIEEEFGKWWDSIDSDNKWETDRDEYKHAFTAGFHVTSKSLMEENEIIKKQLAEWRKCYVSRTNEVIALRGDWFELREALDLATSQLTGFIDSDKVFTELRLKFNLDNESKGEKV